MSTKQIDVNVAKPQIQRLPEESDIDMVTRIMLQIKPENRGKVLQRAGWRLMGRDDVRKRTFYANLNLIPECTTFNQTEALCITVWFIVARNSMDFSAKWWNRYACEHYYIQYEPIQKVKKESKLK